MNKRLLPLLSGLFLIAASPAFAALSVSLSPNVSSPQPVGTTITWTATVSGDPDTSPVYEYQFSANLTGSPTLIRRGYSHLNTFIWTPSAADGAFTVGVIVKNVHVFTEATHTAAFTLSTRLPAGSCATDPAACAAVNTTNNPLVALFTGTSCLSPNSMVVFFKPTTAVPPGGITALQQTSPQPCRHTTTVADTSSMNFYIAGMYPSTTYSTYYETLTPTNTVVHKGPTLTFTTGAIPSNVFFPTFTASGTSTDLTEPIILNSNITIPDSMGHVYAPSATDLAGNVIWYSTNVPPIRTELGGNYLGTFGGGTDIYAQGFREVDLAGNTVLEESVGAVSEQMVAAGQKPLINFNHEVRRLYGPTSAAPTGDIFMIADEENISPSEAECFFDPTTLGAQGGSCTAPNDIFAEQVIVLNSNLKLVWNWDEATHFDINQPPPLGELCTGAGGGGCPPITAFDFATGATFTSAIDWMHTNSLQYTSYDGNIVVSSRHQDVVFKINYGNGTGDGHVIWEQGPADLKDENGNALPRLTVSTNNPVTIGSYDLGYPWNSHQHDANIQIINNHPFLTLYDDGNERVKKGGFDPGGNGRCLLYALNETALTSNLNIDGDVGSYSFAVGSAQLLANGSLSCDSGYITETIIVGDGPANGVPTLNSMTTENSNATGSPVVYSMASTEGNYRSFRMSSLYNPVLY
jgi:hypothetical protein